jgi:hypothetical protein
LFNNRVNFETDRYGQSTLKATQATLIVPSAIQTGLFCKATLWESALNKPEK